MNVGKRHTKLISIWLRDENFYNRSVLENEAKLRQEGEKKALTLFYQAAKRVPAYRDFLHKHNINPQTIKDIKDFRKVPAITKKSYIEKYDLGARCWDGSLEEMHMISTSSGTTGEPHFWPRNLLNEIEGAYAHEFIFKEIFESDKKRTFFINGFALGNWIAGTFTSSVVNLVAWKGYPITIMTPGYSTSAIIELLETIASQFEQTIITGHTPFLKEVIEEAVDQGLDLKQLNIKLLGTGQGITERWREYMVKLLRSDNYYRTFINLYGSADAALMGFETPFSIYIRKVLSEDIGKSKEVFKSERLPSLYNYDPRLIYFEAIEGEIHITKDYGCPLIRYNIQDEGGIFSFSEIASYFNKNRFVGKTKNIPQWKLPFVYLFGRDKFMVKIYGANVYTEHVQHALDHEKLQSFLTGRFRMEMDYDENHNPYLICRVELRQGVDDHSALIGLTQKIFVEEVRKVNSEYNFILGEIGDRAKPIVIVHKHGDPKYFPRETIKKTA